MIPAHPRLISGEPTGLIALGEWRAGHRDIPVRAAFKLGRDVAEALTCLHLVGLSAGQVSLDSIYVNADASEAYLRPVEIEPAPVAPAESTGYREARSADLVELGVVLFELCCRRALRPREDLRHIRRGFTLVTLNNPRVPAAGDALISALLAPAPGQGYERAKQVLDELRRIVAELDGVVAAPTATPSLLGKRIDDLLAGWKPKARTVPAPASAAPAPRPLLRRVAAGLSLALALLWVFAPTDSDASVEPAPRASVAVAAKAPVKDRAAMARQLIAMKQELMRSK